MDFSEIARCRFAAESFDSGVLGDDQVEALLELIRLAPSSFNLQPWRIKVVPRGEQLERLAAASYNQAQVATCSHLLVFLADTRLEELADRLGTLMEEGGIVERRRIGFLAMIRAFIARLEGPARLAWAQRQVYLALSHGLAGACELGFDACPMEGFAPDAFTEILGLPDCLVPTVLLPLGTSAEPAPPKLRFASEELIFD